MNPRNNIEKWILADWSTNRSPEVPKNTEIKSEQSKEQKAVDNSCKYNFKHNFSLYISNFEQKFRGETVSSPYMNRKVLGIP